MAPITIKDRLIALGPDFQKICAIAGTPGLSVVVSNRGEVIHRADFGCADLETRAPVTADTVYPLGALAKTFTASAVSILVDEGKLKWTTPVKDIVPGFRSRSAIVTEELTVVDLLSHRTGLSRANHWWQGAEGVALLEKSQLLSYYANLAPVKSFRSEWAYSNWGYALLGEVIEELSGMSYGDLIQQRILSPLGLNNTSFRKLPSSGVANLAKPYGVLDDANPVPIALASLSESIMAPAMGGASTADDLMKYTLALLKAYRIETGREVPERTSQPVIRHAQKQMSGHMFTGTAITESSYAFGFYRCHLPNAVKGMGVNALYVDKMPILVPKDVYAGPVLTHGGSLPGYNHAIAVLPEMDCSVVVCTNSLSLGYVSAWVTMAVLEALMETPQPTDYVKLAAEGARSNAAEVVKLKASLEKAKASRGPHKPLAQYVGRYGNQTFSDWYLDVREKTGGGSGLEVVFQGLDSQAWDLEHYEDDIFLWLPDRNVLAQRGHQDGQIQGVAWNYEPGVPAADQIFLKYKS
ncbi:putative D-aminoacylase [Xylariales sp. PMI_506]|nr:putative D-aminoacylase [Xylariales sp. PMI_506]